MRGFRNGTLFALILGVSLCEETLAQRKPLPESDLSPAAVAGRIARTPRQYHQELVDIANQHFHNFAAAERSKWFESALGWTESSNPGLRGSGVWFIGRVSGEVSQADRDRAWVRLDQMCKSEETADEDWLRFALAQIILNSPLPQAELRVDSILAALGSSNPSTSVQYLGAVNDIVSKAMDWMGGPEGWGGKGDPAMERRIDGLVLRVVGAVLEKAESLPHRKYSPFPEIMRHAFANKRLVASSAVCAHLVRFLSSAIPGVSQDAAAALEGVALYEHNQRSIAGLTRELLQLLPELEGVTRAHVTIALARCVRAVPEQEVSSVTKYLLSVLKSPEWWDEHEAVPLGHHLYAVMPLARSMPVLLRRPGSPPVRLEVVGTIRSHLARRPIDFVNKDASEVIRLLESTR